MADVLTMDRDLTEEELQKEYEKLDFATLGFTPISGSKARVEVNKTGKVSLKPHELKPSQFKTNYERFHFICKDLPSPEIFIDLNFLFMMASCAARNLWVCDGGGDNFRFYSNQYAFLVGPPGIGKSAPANYVKRMLDGLIDTKMGKDGKFTELKLINMGPDATSFEKLVLRASNSTDSVKLPNGKYYMHSSTTFLLGDEVENLLHSEAQRTISFLLAAYDCGSFEQDTIKHGVKKLSNICVNFFGCATAGIMKGLLKRGLINNNGFLGRTLIVYADKERPNKPPFWRDGPEEAIEQEHIKRHLRRIAKMLPTQATLSEESQRWMTNWHEKDRHVRLNDNPLLADFYARRKAQIIKFALAYMISEPTSDDKVRTTLEVRDLEAAKKFISRTELDMHRGLGGGNENEIANIAEEISNSLQKNGPTSIKGILLKFFSMGDQDMINSAIEFLRQTGQVQSITLAGGKQGLKYVRKQENFELM